MSSFTFQKADGNASGFHKYPRADGIQTRSNPQKNNTSSLNRTRRTLESERNSKTKLYKFEQRTLQAAGIRIRTHNNQTLSQQILDHGGFCSSDNKLWWCGNPRPEGNIRPKPLIFFSFPSFWNWNSETWHHMHISEFMNFRCQTSFYRILPIQNLSVLAHKPMKPPQIWSLAKQIGSLLWVKTLIWTSGPTA